MNKAENENNRTYMWDDKNRKTPNKKRKTSEHTYLLKIPPAFVHQPINLSFSCVNLKTLFGEFILILRYESLSARSEYFENYNLILSAPVCIDAMGFHIIFE